MVLCNKLFSRTQWVDWDGEVLTFTVFQEHRVSVKLNIVKFLSVDLLPHVKLWSTVASAHGVYTSKMSKDKDIHRKGITDYARSWKNKN